MLSQPRAVTLYYATIGIREAALLVWGVLTAPVASASARRRRFHSEVVRRTRARAAFSFSSARGALAACLRGAGIGPGDEVLLSSYTCLAVPTAVIAAGATPTYSDIDPHSLNVTVEGVLAALTPRTRAIVVQHTLGSVAPVREIVEVARVRGIIVIEDCALSIGSSLNGHSVGTTGDAAIYSMELSKTVTTGWGGVLTINNLSLADDVGRQYDAVAELPGTRSARMAVQIAITGVASLPWVYPIGKYIVYHGFARGLFLYSTPPGELSGIVGRFFVAKLPGPQARLALHQWLRLDKVSQACDRNGTRLRTSLKARGYEPLGAPGVGAVAVAPRVSVLVQDRPGFMRFFESAEVYLGSWFDGPLSPLPESDVFNYDVSRYPNAAYVAQHVVNFPAHSGLADCDLNRLDWLLGEFSRTQVVSSAPDSSGA